MQRDTNVEPVTGREVLWFDIFIGGQFHVRKLKGIIHCLAQLGKITHDGAKGFTSNVTDVELFGGAREIFLGHWFRSMSNTESRFIASDVLELKKNPEGADLDSLCALLVAEEIDFDMPFLIMEKDAGSEAGVRYMRRYRPRTTRLIQYAQDNLDRPVVRADELHRRFRGMTNNHFVFGGDDPLTEAKIEAAIEDLVSSLVPPINQLDMNTLPPVRLIED